MGRQRPTKVVPPPEHDRSHVLITSHEEVMTMYTSPRTPASWMESFKEDGWTVESKDPVLIRMSYQRQSFIYIFTLTLS